MTVDRSADFFPARINLRVPDMRYVCDVAAGPGPRLMAVDFGTPAALATAGLVSALTAATAAQTFTTGLPAQVSGTAGAKWGRCLTANANGTAANAVGTWVGRDYLGQRMTELFTLASTTAKTGAKAFAYLDWVVLGSNANATDVVIVGYSDKLGLPYAAVILKDSLMNGDTAGAHTLVARSTAAASAASGDPRGTITLSTAANGTRTFSAIVQLDSTQMHGVAQA